MLLDVFGGRGFWREGCRGCDRGLVVGDVEHATCPRKLTVKSQSNVQRLPITVKRDGEGVCN